MIGALVVAGVGGGFAAGWFLRAGQAAPVAAAADVTAHDAPAPAPVADPNETTVTREAAFDGVYKDAVWGTNDQGVGNSGFGSKLRTTLLYRTFLQDLMQQLHVTSVVDAGCGDWEFSSVLDWTGIDYKGYDIVPKVVDHDNATYAKPNIHFFTADIVDADLPPADLLISKHVLQHLSNADVQKFIDKQLPKYKVAVLTDGVSSRTMTSPNPDIKPGEYRPLDLTKPPFNLRGARVLTYWDGGNMSQVVLVFH